MSALVTMYSHEEDIDSAIEVFTQAIQWYQNHQVSKCSKIYNIKIKSYTSEFKS